MRRATTPTIIINLDTNLTNCWYRVAFKQRGLPTLIKDQNDCILSEDGNSIEVYLTQEETLAFSSKHKVSVQVKFGIGEKVCATNIIDINVKDILDEEVIG